MFVYNLKVDSKLIAVGMIIIISMFIISLNFTNLFKKDKNNIPKEEIDFFIDTENFTQTIKQIHENIDNNIGKHIEITGFVFRMPDFQENYFVCGRNVVVDGEDKVAGIMCDYKNNGKFLDGKWVKIQGVIAKGNYKNEMPIITVKNIEEIDSYPDSYVEIK